MMQLVSVFVIFSASLPVAFTAPFAVFNTTNTTVAPGALQGEYYLLTEVIGSGNADKNDLYVSGYHTGTVH